MQEAAKKDVITVVQCIKLKPALKKPIKNYCKEQHNDMYILHKKTAESQRSESFFNLFFTRSRTQLALRDKTNDRTLVHQSLSDGTFVGSEAFIEPRNKNKLTLIKKSCFFIITDGGS